MREIHTDQITEIVAELCQKANFYLPQDVLAALRVARETEESSVGKEVLEQILQNAEIAAREEMPICQDCGIVTAFLELGQEIQIVGGDLPEAVNVGVSLGYQAGYLRKSIVSDPCFRRRNTGDNTPAIIYPRIVSGDKLRIEIVPKGGGTENMSTLGMLSLVQGLEGVKKFILETVKKAGANPCPPLIVGVGVGGSFASVGLLSQQALLRPIAQKNLDEDFAELEDELLEGINRLGIGPAGLGGRVTALAVKIKAFPTHLACLPVAVNLSCHALRHAEAVI